MTRRVGWLPTVVALIVAFMLTGHATPRPGPTFPPVRPEAPHADVSPSPTATADASSRESAPPVSPEQAVGATRSGIASWGWFGGHVVTRLPRGTRIEVCGKLGCWSGRSWGYGPARSTGRIVDLDVAVFEAICGPRSRGLCGVTLSWGGIR